MGVSKTGKTPASYYKSDVSVSQTSNTGFDSTTRKLCSGDGADSAASLSDDVLSVQPVNDDTTGTMLVKNQGGSNILTVDTTNSKVLTGASQISANTHFKEMGLYDFSPTVGYHNPLIANNMMFSDSGDDIIEDQSMFGNGADPAETLDLSANGTPRIAVACYWFLDNDITIDSVRYAVSTDGEDNLDFHLESYTIDTSANFGDLSAGVTVASVHEVAATHLTYKTGTLSLSSSDIDAGKVVIGFVESDSITDITCTLNINYYIR